MNEEGQEKDGDDEGVKPDLQFKVAGDDGGANLSEPAVLSSYRKPQQTSMPPPESTVPTRPTIGRIRRKGNPPLRVGVTAASKSTSVARTPRSVTGK